MKITQIIKVVDKTNIKIISITIFHMFRKVEERLTMLCRNMENGGERPKLNSENKNFNV